MNTAAGLPKLSDIQSPTIDLSDLATLDQTLKMLRDTQLL